MYYFTIQVISDENGVDRCFFKFGKINERIKRKKKDKNCQISHISKIRQISKLSLKTLRSLICKKKWKIILLIKKNKSGMSEK